jgi:hypothetical protein
MSKKKEFVTNQIVTFNLPIWVVEALKRQAEKEGRSASNMATVILEKWYSVKHRKP